MMDKTEARHIVRPRARLYRAESAWCFMCDSEIVGEAVGVDHPSDGIDLHPHCALKLASDIRDACFPGPEDPQDVAWLEAYIHAHE